MPVSVSIIVPAFNSAKFLPQTIESVLAQTVGDWEMIISDDGSSDDTVAIARRFGAADSRIHVIQNSPAGHPGPTRNAAIAAAQGKYIALLDSDDLWLPRKLETQLNAIARVPNPGICYTLAESFSDDPATPARPMFPHAPPPDRESQYSHFLLTCNQACTSSQLLEREFAREIGPFTAHPLLVGHEDWDFVLRAIRRRPLVFVPQTLVRYRVHGNSVTDRRRRQWERRFEIYRQVELRGEMPPGLRNRCYSTAWLVRAEVELESGMPGWRRSFLKALSLDPANWRRWPALMSLVLNQPMMRRTYDGLKRVQQRQATAAHPSEPSV